VKTAGLVLAAGAGRRMGTPKALVRDADSTAWVVRASRLLTESGCAPVVVVVGAAAPDVRAELSTEPVEIVEATDWATGMSASLRAGLTTLTHTTTRPTPTPTTSGSVPSDSEGLDSAGSASAGPDSATHGSASAGSDSAKPASVGSGVGAVVVVPVDVPGLTVAAVRRVVHEVGSEALARATYDGMPGHPVVIGRVHWDGVIASARGDEGARGYLRAHDVVLVECGDVGDGADVDTVAELPPGHG
jgi:nicotine blue oxidoreductase